MCRGYIYDFIYMREREAVYMCRGYIYMREREREREREEERGMEREREQIFPTSSNHRHSTAFGIFFYSAGSRT